MTAEFGSLANPIDVQNAVDAIVSGGYVSVQYHGVFIMVFSGVNLAAIARKSVADAFIGDEEKTFRHLFTFGGHPAACAGSLANLEILEQEDMVENSAQMGKYLYEQLQTLYEHPMVGDIGGGLALLASVELVKDRNTKEKFPKDAKLGEKLTRSFRKHSILIRQRRDVVCVSPPLCITSEEVDFVVRNLDEVLSEVERELG